MTTIAMRSSSFFIQVVADGLSVVVVVVVVVVADADGLVAVADKCCLLLL